MFIDKSLYDEFSASGVPNVGDLLITAVGTLGKVYIVNTPSPIYFKDGSVLCFSNYSKLNPTYLKYAIESPMFVNQYIGESQGTTVATLTMVRVNEYLIPIPPLKEQGRIVTALANVLPIVQKYSVSKQRLDSLNENVKPLMRKSILQEAIQGRLVAQCETDEPASVLLKKISAEKERLLKEGKLKKSALTDSLIFKGDDNRYWEKRGKETVCIDDEIPFEIPNTWLWSRLGFVFSHCTGKALNSSNNKGTPLQYITTSNLYWDRFEIDTLRTMPFTDEELEKCTITKGDLLVCEGGDVGRAAIWNFDFDMRIQNHIHKLRSYVPLTIKFFYYVFFHYKHSGMIGGKGIGIKGLSSGALHKLLIPIPPIKEQERIVAEIERTWQVL